MFASSKTKSIDTMDSFLLVAEAKKEWPDSAIPQILCEAGCLLKKRLADVASKMTSAYLVKQYIFATSSIRLISFKRMLFLLAR